MARRPGGTAASPHDELPAIDVFVVGPGGALLDRDSPELEHLDDVAAHRDTSVAWEIPVETVGQPRTGVAMERPARQGAGEDVIHPVLVPPRWALGALLDGSLVVRPVRRLTIDASSLARNNRGLTWDATVRVGVLRRRRAAQLRIHASTSTNLTVVELRPRRPRRKPNRRFVRTGVRIVEAVGERLLEESLLASTPRGRVG
jgi:hypothetical protein